ncbi:DUF47 domain-containing protein [Caldinitratiruptor microaerophilus]|uniref:DUF47 domain-containing protein n=1 Tax=Caldinitratiruptor microaerophilus TaxID=671077 RepID=A0AA35G750_9FIRM|nr:DUF47 family protein [Caldinitratiruptor microaerophilus]BDG58923.1 hypothetical protein caldi_00130 [Caldinitratiruptor microaerophilus]
MLFASHRDRQFFSLLRDAAQNLAESAQVFWDLSQATGRADEYAARLKDLEKRGDRYTHDLITLLNKLFVTPLDREDILRLAVVLDDVVDGLEAAASRIFIYRVDEDNRYIREFASLIMGQAEEVVQAVERLQTKDLLRIRENAVQINVLENQGDDLLREALANLLNHEQDPVRIIKLKEIFETLETVTDRAEDVANALESVVMKHA